MKNVLVITNPYSGKEVVNDNLDEMKSILYSNGYDPIFVKTKSRGHATEIVNSIDGVDLVISDGGDGTLHEVVVGNLKRKKPLTIAHLPTGTTNDFGHSLGYEKDKLLALRQILTGEEKEVDFFSINDVPFVYVVGAGQFLNIPYSTSKEQKNKFGHMAYLADGVNAWMKGTKKYPIKYEIDGREFETDTSILLVGNSKRVAGFNFFKEDIVKMDDGLFEFVIIDASTRLELLSEASKLLFKGITKINKAKVIQTDNLKIKFYEPLLHDWCIDGERFEEENEDLEYEFKKCNKVKMLLPKKNLNKLFTK